MCLTFVRMHLITVYRTVFWGVRCSVVEWPFVDIFTTITISVLFRHDNYGYYWDVYVHYYLLWTTALGLVTPGNIGSAILHPRGCFCPWTFFKNIGFNTLLSDPFMSNSYSQLGYSTGDGQALQLIVLAVLGALASSMLVHFLETWF